MILSITISTPYLNSAGRLFEALERNLLLSLHLLADDKSGLQSSSTTTLSYLGWRSYYQGEPQLKNQWILIWRRRTPACELQAYNPRATSTQLAHNARNTYTAQNGSKMSSLWIYI